MNLKGRAHQINIFWKAHNIKSVLSVHAQIVFKSLGGLVKKENGYKVSACLILNIVPKAASEFLFQLSFAVTGRLSLVQYMAFGTISEQFSESQADLGTLFRVTGGFLKAGKSFLKRVTGRIFKGTSRNLNLKFSP